MKPNVKIGTTGFQSFCHSKSPDHLNFEVSMLLPKNGISDTGKLIKKLILLINFTPVTSWPSLGKVLSF